MKWTQSSGRESGLSTVGGAEHPIVHASEHGAVCAEGWRQTQGHLLTISWGSGGASSVPDNARIVSQVRRHRKARIVR